MNAVSLHAHGRSTGLLLDLHKAHGDEFLLRLMMAMRVTHTQTQDLYLLHAECGGDMVELKKELDRWLTESPDPLSEWIFSRDDDGRAHFCSNSRNRDGCEPDGPMLSQSGC